jgi:aminodeoxyfutalosine deaminase
MRISPLSIHPGTASELWTLTARWIFPVAGPPLERGTITIQGEHIVAVESEGRRPPDQDLGNTAILPGLVNAHTHLDLSTARTVPDEDFTAWLRAVVTHRRSQTPQQAQDAVMFGLSECLRFGTTLVGDISADGASWGQVAAAPLRAVVFRELIGLSAERTTEALSAARAWLETTCAAPTCRPGLSPHAPYSVCRGLFAGAGELAREFAVPLAVHLAETPAELELLSRRQGPFVAFLTDLDLWNADLDLAVSPAEIMALCGDDNVKLFVHANYLAAEAPLPPRSAVIYCPRTQAAFGDAPHPFREFLTRGVRVALGTDSLASNPDLDILAEARFLHEHNAYLPGATLLRMATLSGAEALGWDAVTGSLTLGKSADLIVLPLPNEDIPDPHRLVLESALAVRSVMVQGRWVQ